MYLRVLILLLLVAAPGCVSRQQLKTTIDLMRIEYLALESSYGELEHEYAMTVHELESTQATLDALQSKDGSSSTSSGSSQGDDPDIDLPTFRGPDKDQSPDVEVPQIELPNFNSDDKKSGTSSRGGTPVRSASSAEGRTPSPTLQFSSPASKRPFDMNVTHVIIAPYVSTGRDFDGQPGDDGISLVIEPRNGDDLFVPVAGELTISVLDAAEDGDNKRVALWQFDKNEVQRRMRDLPGLGRGINLKLPWPKRAPRHSNLTVFVRYRKIDGKLLETSADIKVAPPGENAVAWTGRQGKVGSGLAQNQQGRNGSRVGSNHRGVGPLPGGNSNARDYSAEPGGLSPPGTEVARPTWKPFR